MNKQLHNALLDAQNHSTKLQLACINDTLYSHDLAAAHAAFSRVLEGCVSALALQQGAILEHRKETSNIPHVTPRDKVLEFSRQFIPNTPVSQQCSITNETPCNRGNSPNQHNIIGELSSSNASRNTESHNDTVDLSTVDGAESSGWRDFDKRTWRCDEDLPSRIYQMWYVGSNSQPSVTWMDSYYGCRNHWVCNNPGLKRKLIRRGKIIERLDRAVSAGYSLEFVLPQADRISRQAGSQNALERLCNDPEVFFLKSSHHSGAM